MELNDLLIFKTVANEGSISKAAEKLGYVQPNVTERIKKLEQMLETPLLNRTNKGVTLRPSGEILLDYTNKILHLIEEAKNEIKMSSKSYRIATSQAILANYLSTRIKENFHRYQIYLENSNQLPTLLKKQEVDMVISYEDYSDPALEKVYSTTISMGLLKAKGRTDVDVSKEFFFVSHDEQCPFRNHTLRFMEEHHLAKQQLLQLDSYSLITDFIVQGKGLAFLPVNHDSLEKVEIFHTEEVPIYFFTNRKSEQLIPSSELFF